MFCITLKGLWKHGYHAFAFFLYVANSLGKSYRSYNNDGDDLLSAHYVLGTVQSAR